MSQYNTTPQHFYSLTFQRLHDEGGQSLANAYVGLAEQKVTKAVIEFARDLSRIEAGSVLINVSYLGFLSEAEFHAPA